MASDASSESTLDAKQIVFLFMAATVVAVVVFLCGVLVGRGVPGGGGGGAASVRGSLSVDDLPPATLSVPRDEPSAAALASDDLTYPRRLTGDTDVTERLDDFPVGPETEDTPPPEEGAAGPAPEPPDPAPSLPAEGGGRLVDASSVSGYVVQVSASRAADMAQSLADQLTEKGFPAFVLAPYPDEPSPFYRVWVGPFDDREAATRIRDRLQAEEGFEPYVTQP